MFDPFDSRRFATFSEDEIKIFDLRNTKKPQFRIKEDRPLDKDKHPRFGGFEWCASRPNLLMSFYSRQVSASSLIKLERGLVLGLDW